MRRTWMQRMVLLCLGLAGLSCGGCRAINSEVATLFGDTSSSAAAAAAMTPSHSGGTYAVELRADGRKPELVQLPWNETVYVQQALEQSGAIKRFRRMKIELYRQLPSGGGHRLDVPFDRGSRQVPPGSDYALHEHDRVVITEDSSTIVDDMLHSITGG